MPNFVVRKQSWSIGLIINMCNKGVLSYKDYEQGYACFTDAILEGLCAITLYVQSDEYGLYNTLTERCDGLMTAIMDKEWFGTLSIREQNLFLDHHVDVKVIEPNATVEQIKLLKECLGE